MLKQPLELFMEQVIQRGFSQVGEALPFYHSWVRGLWGQLSFIPLRQMKRIVLHAVHAGENKRTKWS